MKSKLSHSSECSEFGKNHQPLFLLSATLFGFALLTHGTFAQSDIIKGGVFPNATANGYEEIAGEKMISTQSFFKLTYRTETSLSKLQQTYSYDRSSNRSTMLSSTMPNGRASQGTMVPAADNSGIDQTVALASEPPDTFTGSGTKETTREEAGWRTDYDTTRVQSTATFKTLADKKRQTGLQTSLHEWKAVESGSQELRATQAGSHDFSQKQLLTTVTTASPVVATSTEEHAHWDGSDIFTDDSPDLEIFHLNKTVCDMPGRIRIRALKGEINGWVERDSNQSTNIDCYWEIRVPAGMHIVAVIMMAEPCMSRFEGRIYAPSPNWSRTDFDCEHRLRRVIFSVSSRLGFNVYDRVYYYENYVMPSVPLKWRVRFQVVEEDFLATPSIVFKSPTFGIVTPFGFDGRDVTFHNTLAGGARCTINVPETKNVMISFPYFSFGPENCEDYNRFDLMTVTKKGTLRSVWSECRRQALPAEVYHESLFIRYTVKEVSNVTGFKMFFSLHAKSKTPHKLDSGLFNCSVPHYGSFKQHLHCNLDGECHGGEDEGHHCPFSPPGCNGLAGYKNKCYKLMSSSKPVTRDEADRKCRSDGGELAMMKNTGEWDALKNVFVYGKLQPDTLIGMRNPTSEMSDLYRFGYMWKDGTVVYDKSVYVVQKRFANSFLYSVLTPDRVRVAILTSHKYFMCQFLIDEGTAAQSSRGVHFPQTHHLPEFLANTTNRLTGCKAGHVTHDFLSCDPESHCDTELHVPFCTLSDTGENDGTTVNQPYANAVAMFVCDNKRSTLHYTLVCDFREDCSDGSDESFCLHQNYCEGFTCDSGQCVALDQQCNFMSDCLDRSDENNCNYINKNCIAYFKGCLYGAAKRYVRQLHLRQPAPASVKFNYSGFFFQESMHISQPCPSTHFRCPGESNYCLPVYVRCNGVYDCVGHEDEADCESYTCPGFYRCRASSVCVHVDHLCDDLNQCPQRDDELLCDATCPEGCRCQGLAFVCKVPFPAHSFPELRYLDARNSGVAPRDLTSNFKLLWLSLARCSLKILPPMTFPNLRTIDLSYNRLRSLNREIVSNLRNLQDLSLAGNPLVSIVSETPSVLVTRLKRVDVSNTLLQRVDNELLSWFPSVEFLNISFTRVKTLSKSNFQHLSKLSELDMRGISLQEYTDGLLKNLENLQVLHAENYRLCCKNMLPDFFDSNVCSAPDDEVSSCEFLIKSDIHRLVLWTMCILSVTGNLGCMLMKLLTQDLKTGIDVLVLNLNIANLVMGIHLAEIGVADRLFSGSYMLHEDSWQSSEFCTVAGFLWLLSSEVSTFIICLITLDRVLVLRSPSTQLRFQRRSAVVTCVVAWVVGTVLAGVPLLPEYVHWQFYSQNGACLPLPVTKDSFHGRDYSFWILCVFSTCLYLVIAGGQFYINRSVRKSTNTSSLNTSQDVVTARCLASVAIADCLCWCTVGFLGIMFRMGFPDTEDPSLRVAIYLLSLSSAVNPFLYILNVHKEKQRLVETERLMSMLKSRLAYSKKSTRQSNVV